MADDGVLIEHDAQKALAVVGASKDIDFNNPTSIYETSALVPITIKELMGSEPVIKKLVFDHMAQSLEIQKLRAELAANKAFSKGTLAICSTLGTFGTAIIGVGWKLLPITELGWSCVALGFVAVLLGVWLPVLSTRTRASAPAQSQK